MVGKWGPILWNAESLIVSTLPTWNTERTYFYGFVSSPSITVYHPVQKKRQL